MANIACMTSRIVLLLAALVAASALAATASAADTAAPAGLTLAPTKTFLLGHTTQLVGFTNQFRTVADRYYAAARTTGFDYATLWGTKPGAVSADLAKLKKLWIAGNPYYEQVEGVVAGTPSLAVYDVILDAGSSAAEDPASAVPFDLKLAEREGAPQAGQPLQPDRGHALGHASRVHAPARPIWIGTESSSSARCSPTPTLSSPPRPHSPSTPGSSTAPRGRGARARRTRSRPSS